jgi:O-antigen/teichoic acid export membrane protein
LNVVLIPTAGLVGAAVAWAASLTLDSVLCAVRGRRLLGVSPPWGGLLLAGAIAVASFGVPGLAVRLLVPPTLAWLAVYAVLATGCYLLLLLRFRERLGLENLPEILRRPR